jgi:uncharacterized protein (DUF362 family)/Pyruvate/2-oxoacid:ferredoxin oxidoreductase delta subunit
MYSAALIKSENYNNCYNNLKKGFRLLGGISKYIKKNEKILVKPNFLKAADVEKAVTTHPEIIKAIIKIIIDCGAIPLIGDSPGMGTPEKVLEKLGLTDFIKKNNVKLVDCYTQITKTIKYKNRLIKFVVFKGIEDADKIFTVAKLKTHGMMYYTGAIKNLFGVIPGGLKPELHYKFSEYRDFADMLTDLLILTKPAFSIIDGITAMEGNGPGSGKPRNLNCIIMSDNALTADICACDIIGYKPEQVPVLDSAVKKNLGPKTINEIKILGDTLNEFRVKDFKKVGNLKKVYRMVFPVFDWLIKKLMVSKPVAKHKECVLCGECIKICAAKAVQIKNKKIKFDYKKCIRCYCCQEICPEGAIKISKPILLKYADFFIKKL